MNDKQKEEILNSKRFGYVVSAILLIISNISLINKWSVTPLLFLITMYFLTAALWIPALIKPFYKVFKNFLDKRTGKKDDSKNSGDYFLKN
jgi:hypothetical protein